MPDSPRSASRYCICVLIQLVDNLLQLFVRSNWLFKSARTIRTEEKASPRRDLSRLVSILTGENFVPQLHGFFIAQFGKLILGIGSYRTSLRVAMGQVLV